MFLKYSTVLESEVNYVYFRYRGLNGEYKSRRYCNNVAYWRLLYHLFTIIELYGMGS